MRKGRKGRGPQIEAIARRARRGPEVRGYARLPAGHQEAWADAFCNLM